MRIDIILAFIIAFFGLLGLALIFVASIVALFKIDEADRYYGVEGIASASLPLKGLPFSLGRMTVYGMVILFENTHYVQKRYGRQLAQVNANTPPEHLKNLLMWLYASWFLCGVIVCVLGGILTVLF